MRKMMNKPTKVKVAGIQGKKTPLKSSIAFCLDAPEAESVCLAGDFNGWDVQALPLKRGRDGVWRIKKGLKAGCYEYKFLTDLGWIETLPGVESVMNPYGTRNFVIRVE